MSKKTPKVRAIDPKKLRAARGTRSRATIARTGDCAFNAQRIWDWEHGVCQPQAKHIPAYLEALGVTFEEVLTDEAA